MEKANQVLITNPSLNCILKPNNIENSYTVGFGQYSEAGILIKTGSINHQKAMIFDIVYDRIYRLINEVPNTDGYVTTSLKISKETESENRKLLSKKKFEFYSKIFNLLKHMQNGNQIPFTTAFRNELLYAPKDIIDDAFPLEFGFEYRNDLEFKAQERGNFDKIINLFKEYDIKKYFFEYLLNVIFYGKLPSWNGQKLIVNLNSVFENKERSVYLLKKWFTEITELSFSMTYPATCFLGDKPSFKLKGPYMFPIQSVYPFHNLEYDKANMSVSLSLRNQFMSLFSHDAKMCLHRFIPSKLYKMGNNEFFIGKNLLNNIYYHSRKKAYQSKLNYTMDDLFQMLNLPSRDLNNGNTSNRRKSILKALGRLNDNRIINIDKLNSERLVLNSVWNINRDNCNQRV